MTVSKVIVSLSLILLVLMGGQGWAQRAEDTQLARLSPWMVGSAPTCGTGSEPAGDIESDGFETPGYELSGWTQRKVGDTCTVTSDYALSGLSGGIGDAHNCNYGLKVSTDVTYCSMEQDMGTQTDVYMKFSFYVDSHTLASSYAADIAEVGGWSSYGEDVGRVRLTGTAVNSVLTIKAGDATGGNWTTARNINIDTWYYVKFYVKDASTSCYITVGTTYDGTDIANGDTFTCRDSDNAWPPRYYQLGNYANVYTIDIIFGYVAVDDDGTF